MATQTPPSIVVTLPSDEESEEESDEESDEEDPEELQSASVQYL